MAGSQDPNVVDPGNSTYSLRSPDSVPAVAIPTSDMARVLPRQTSTGLARGVQQLGSPNVYVDAGNEQIVVAKTDNANSNIPRVLMGNQANYGEGFFVTKSAIDVTSASNDSDFIFNSNQNVFKIIDTIHGNTINVTTDACPAGQVITNVFNFVRKHTYGYAPAVIGYLNASGSNYSVPRTVYNLTDTLRYANIMTQVYSTQTQIVLELTVFISCIGSASPLTLTIAPNGVTIYILQETAN